MIRIIGGLSALLGIVIGAYFISFIGLIQQHTNAIYVGAGIVAASEFVLYFCCNRSLLVTLGYTCFGLLVTAAIIFI